MKKRLSALAIALCLSLTACGGGTDTPIESSSTPPPVQSEQSAPVPAPTPEPAPQPVPVLVEGELDFSGYDTLAANALPDLLYWSNGGASYDGEPVPKDTYQIYKYRSSMDVVKDYVAMLCENGYTLVDQYSIKDLHSWGFVSDTVEAPTTKMMYTDTPCHFSIWTNGEKKFRTDVPYEFDVCDTGTRRGGGGADLAPQGPSAAAGLIRLPDGSYQTTDGRLTASVGSAAVIRDGRPLTCSANLIMRDDDGSDRLWVEDYYRNEGFYFESPRSYLMQGDLFQMSDLSRERAYSTAKDAQDAQRKLRAVKKERQGGELFCNGGLRRGKAQRTHQQAGKQRKHKACPRQRSDGGKEFADGHRKAGVKIEVLRVADRRGHGTKVRRDGLNGHRQHQFPGQGKEQRAGQRHES